MSAVRDMTPPLFVPWDIEVARINFGANCGPAAFAAVTQREVCRVMQYFPHFPERQWTNATQMLRALSAAGYRTRIEKCATPSHGVALVQWLGPWTAKDFFSRWSLIHTHWVGVDGEWIFDHNACGWQTVAEWVTFTAAEIIREIPSATGWRIKYGIEVTRGMQFDLGFPAESREVTPCQRQAFSRTP